MKIRILTAVLAILSVLGVPVRAADDAGLARMALCQDSWLDWQKSDPAKLKAFANRFRAGFVPHGNDPYLLPKENISVVGLHVAQAFPDSIGMAVGFSLTVDAPFDQTRAAVEKSLGKSLQKCETGDDMRTCAREIGPQRTVTLMAEDSPKAKQTLVGCYYFYEK